MPVQGFMLPTLHPKVASAGKPEGPYRPATSLKMPQFLSHLSKGAFAALVPVAAPAPQSAAITSAKLRLRGGVGWPVTQAMAAVNQNGGRVFLVGRSRINPASRNCPPAPALYLWQGAVQAAYTICTI